MQIPCKYLDIILSSSADKGVIASLRHKLGLYSHTSQVFKVYPWSFLLCPSIDAALSSPEGLAILPKPRNAFILSGVPLGFPTRPLIAALQEDSKAIERPGPLAGVGMI